MTLALNGNSEKNSELHMGFEPTTPEKKRIFNLVFSKL